jgi:hypothetical protein
MHQPSQLMKCNSGLLIKPLRMHHLLYIVRHGLLIVICMLLSYPLFSQARMILNGAIVTIADSAVLVIGNGNANALTRNAGHIVGEGESNRIKWVIGTNSETYTVPWGNDKSGYFPVSFSTSSASGNGYFIFATYPTGWQNSDNLPSGVTNISNNGMDNSAYVLDRFWKISAETYTSKPALNNLVFNYADIEHTEASNTIKEANLIAQNWNDISQTWEDINTPATVNTDANSVTVSSVSPTELYAWWSLKDANVALPLRFLSFDIKMDNSNALLTWVTADELNVDNFYVQKRSNSQSFSNIASLKPSGGTGPNKYSFIDRNIKSGRTEYRILENDLDGRTMFSKIISVVVEPKSGIMVYPNPIKGKLFFIGGLNVRAGNYILTLYDAAGRIFMSQNVRIDSNHIQVELERQPPMGSYFLVLSNKETSIRASVMVN